MFQISKCFWWTFVDSVQISGKNFMPFWSMCPGRVTEIYPSLLLSKDEEGLKNIVHNISIKNLIFGVYSVMVLYLICYHSLLQNATEVYYKMQQKFIVKCISFSTKCNSFIKKCDNFITKCNSYYKMQHLLQIATAQ